MINQLPASVAINPRFDTWLRFQAGRTVRVATGKVEIGQGVVTALSQIAAEELDLDLAQVVMLSGDSDAGPNERYTSSSLSIMDSGAAIRAVCAEARALLAARAALRLNCAVEQLTVAEGVFAVDGAASGVTYWDLADEIDWTQAATGTAAPKDAKDYRIVGKSIPRDDLAEKLTIFCTHVFCASPDRGQCCRNWMRQPLNAPPAGLRFCAPPILSPSLAPMSRRWKPPPPLRPALPNGMAPRR